MRIRDIRLSVVHYTICGRTMATLASYEIACDAARFAGAPARVWSCPVPSRPLLDRSVADKVIRPPWSATSMRFTHSFPHPRPRPPSTLSIPLRTVPIYLARMMRDHVLGPFPLYCIIHRPGGTAGLRSCLISPFCINGESGLGSRGSGLMRELAQTKPNI